MEVAFANIFMAAVETQLIIKPQPHPFSTPAIKQNVPERHSDPLDVKDRSVSSRALLTQPRSLNNLQKSLIQRMSTHKGLCNCWHFSRECIVAKVR